MQCGRLNDPVKSLCCAGPISVGSFRSVSRLASLLSPWPHSPRPLPAEYEIPTPVEAVPEAAHKYWPHEVPHLHYHECAEMAATYVDDTGFGRPFS
eukprot:SAG11_NODE_16481_length_546_cov_0.926174_1_plen_95_part_10